MPSFLMPQNDPNQALDQKLFLLQQDASLQFEHLNNLTIPKKIKVAAQERYNTCVAKFNLLPSRESLEELAADYPANILENHSFYRIRYMMFSEFYKALETLLVCHYESAQHLPGNEYVKNALAKVPHAAKKDLQKNAKKNNETEDHHDHRTHKRGRSHSLFHHKPSKTTSQKTDESTFGNKW